MYSSIVPTSTSRLNASCIASCNCNSSRFEPICGKDGYTYFNPCAAGCQPMDNSTMVCDSSFVGAFLFMLVLASDTVATYMHVDTQCSSHT